MGKRHAIVLKNHRALHMAINNLFWNFQFLKLKIYGSFQSEIFKNYFIKSFF